MMKIQENVRFTKRVLEKTQNMRFLLEKTIKNSYSSQRIYFL